MLKTINNKYIIFSLLIYLLLSSTLNPIYLGLYIVNILTLFAFYIVLNTQLFKTKSHYTKTNLLLIVFFYGLFFEIVYNTLSFVYRNNFFVFSEVDAGTYDFYSLKMSAMSFIDSIHYFLAKFTSDDLGAVLVISNLYRIYESNLTVNLFYLILSLFSALSIYKIGLHLMPNKFAFLASLTYSLSSFVIWFNSSGLKESVLIFLVLQSFLHYYNYLKFKQLKSIFLLVLFLLSILLFRPAITFLIIGSLYFSYLYSHKQKYFQLIIITIFLGILLFTTVYITQIKNKFIGGGNISNMINSKESTGMVKGSLSLTYIVNFIAALIGPLPTILPNNKPMLSMFAPGLIYKTFISVCFLLGIFYMFKRKMYLFFPIALFTLMEMFSLVFILEGLELRKSLPHFPFIYLITFGFLSFFIHGRSLRNKKRKQLSMIINISIYAVFFIIIYWNFAR